MSSQKKRVTAENYSWSCPKFKTLSSEYV
jgi:hypothetical protein